LGLSQGFKLNKKPEVLKSTFALSNCFPQYASEVSKTLFVAKLNTDRNLCVWPADLKPFIQHFARLMTRFSIPVLLNTPSSLSAHGV